MCPGALSAPPKRGILGSLCSSRAVWAGRCRQDALEGHRGPTFALLRMPRRITETGKLVGCRCRWATHVGITFQYRRISPLAGASARRASQRTQGAPASVFCEPVYPGEVALRDDVHPIIVELQIHHASVV